MQSRPIQAFRAGMIAFCESAGLMVTITRVNKNSTSFHVENGEWDGRILEDGQIYVVGPNWTIPGGEFLEVTHLSDDEARAWYVSPAKQRALDRKDLQPETEQGLSAETQDLEDADFADDDDDLVAF